MFLSATILTLPSSGPLDLSCNAGKFGKI